MEKSEGNEENKKVPFHSASENLLEEQSKQGFLGDLFQNPRLSPNYIKRHCDCGRPITAYLIDQNRYVCEQCQATEIYKQDSYKRIVDKVWIKVQNLMKIRTQMCLVFHQQSDRPKNHHHGFCPGLDADGNLLKEAPEERRPSMDMEKVNLFYDLLQVEIEKLRRKNIQEIEDRQKLVFEQQKKQQEQEERVKDLKIEDVIKAKKEMEEHKELSHQSLFSLAQAEEILDFKQDRHDKLLSLTKTQKKKLKKKEKKNNNPQT